ncbi:hypothetical protein EW026_g775 [Hermanssonia centrifuga]|uniref:Xylanolytic transcriptional activator regulatory domain-containing protein n=1 Tax=Hermanssonia centrifuga TaxID=98765 RepID=A0A4S4KTM4_9APHY|nr:hypothetical protein EW026_g775 [Hermanssonia centrifuga]
MRDTACTFLGPSRKRGPPKGYIDAIEARLHQTEALIGILLASKDSRAKTLLEDLSQDTLAKEIIDRVNNSPYGHKGRKRGAPPSGRTRPTSAESKEGDASMGQSAHPSSEWQDLLTTQLNAKAAQRNTVTDDDEAFGDNEAKDGAMSLSYPVSDEEASEDRSSRPSLTLQPAVPEPGSAASSSIVPLSASLDRSDNRSDNDHQSRRQRRRLESDNPSAGPHVGSPSATSMSGRSQSPAQYTCAPPHPALLSKRSRSSLRRGSHSTSSGARDADADEDSGDEEFGSGEDELAIAVGQLSLNEDEQVRYHGKASGLHLLGAAERLDGRNEGGIWRFPKARVWPPLPPTARTPTKSEEDWANCLPSLEMQEHLLELYFTYVHAQLPILHKKAFMDTFRKGNAASVTAHSPMSETSSTSGSQASVARPQRIPVLLLLSMFSVAARYSSTGAPPPEPGSMWSAGDSYMDDAKAILDSSYSQSRPSTCQALLLLGYREVGIGAMAQAWLYIGMAVRMAQDLGLHKSADKWSNTGRTLFTPVELQERRRIWYGCVILDKYVATYIGRPVAISETDFDTELPSVDESDELEGWVPHPTPVFLDDASEKHPPIVVSVPGHIISCFDESAKLSIILSMIMQAIYPIRPHSFRQTEFARVEQLLDKWFIELPEPLRFDPSSPKYLTQPPHILTLHMQYWCTVILLHRPFIRHLSNASSKGLSPKSRENERRANSRKHYDLCVQAANHITAIVLVYMEHCCPRRAAPFLSYYVFTAAIMHVSTLTTYPDDPQASSGLQKCMDMLERMHRVWPSAWRANELLHGSKVLTQDRNVITLPALERQKRVADTLREDPADDSRLSSSQTFRQPQVYPEAGGSGQAQAAFPLDLSIHPAESPSYYQSYTTRWTPDNTLPSLSASLSTSVLPQQYSTGIVDERIQRNHDRPSQRYPQYWSDYSALGQIDTAYGMPVMGDMVPQHNGTPQNDQSMYVPDQYSLFNNLPSSNQ